MTKSSWKAELEKYAARQGLSDFKIAGDHSSWPSLQEGKKLAWREIGCTHEGCPDASLGNIYKHQNHF